MNKLKLKGIVVGFGILAAMNATAETKIHLEINQNDFNDARLNAKPASLSLGAEYVFNKRYSILAKVATHLEKDTATTDSELVDVEVDSIVGIYFKSYLSQSKRLNLFAMAGYTWSKLEGSFSAGQLAQSDDGVSLGLGLEYQINRKFALGINYNRMFDGSESKMDSMNFGVSYAL